MRKLVVIMMMSVVATAAAWAQKPAVVLSNEPGWHKIGEISASFKTQEESIVVLGADRFTSIKLRVTDAPINIEHMQVEFEGGAIQQVDVRNELQAGAETRTIKLDHPNVELKQVTFTYRTLPNYRGEKAEVELYGLKTGQGKSDAYRDDKDRDNDDGDSEKIDDEMREEAREARDEVREEAREAEEDMERDAETTERDTETGAQQVGDEISEAAAIAAAELTDKKHADKVGPNGEIVFIDKHARFYVINKEGKKVFVTKAQLKDKPNKN